LGLDRLLKAMDEGKVQLVTSELTLQEIEKYQDPMQQPRVKRIFRLLQKVPIVRGMSLSACTATATRALGSILP
jgi:predicted nucleic acid-binding protein